MTELKDVDYALFGGSSLFKEKRYKFGKFMEEIPGWVFIQFKRFPIYCQWESGVGVTLYNRDRSQATACVCLRRQAVFCRERKMNNG